MLSAEDREWLEEKFTRVHERIDMVEGRAQKRDSDIHKIDILVTQLKAQGCPSVALHEEKCHNPVKTWGILAGVVGVSTGLLEALRWFLKMGGP